MSDKPTPTCPTCGSGEVESAQESRPLVVPFAEPTTYSVAVHRCRRCGDESDDDDSSFLGAEGAAVKESIGNMLDALLGRGVTMAYIERVLGLPQRTLAQWRAGECPTAGIALLRIICTHPWILEDADQRVPARPAPSAACGAGPPILAIERRFGPLPGAMPDVTLPKSTPLNPLKGCQVRLRLTAGQIEIVSAWVPVGEEWSIDDVPHARDEAGAVALAREALGAYLRGAGVLRDLSALAVPLHGGVL